MTPQTSGAARDARRRADRHMDETGARGARHATGGTPGHMQLLRLADALCIYAWASAAHVPYVAKTDSSDAAPSGSHASSGGMWDMPTRDDGKML